MNMLESFKDHPSLPSILMSSELLDILPCGLSIATDVSCATIIHNPVAANFLRIEPFGEFSHSAPEPPPVKIYEGGRLLRPEDMPMQQAAWSGQEIRNCTLEFVWEDGIAKVARYSASPLRDKEGHISGCLATVEDITNEVHTARELHQHKVHLEELVQARTAELKLAEERFSQAYNLSPFSLLILRKSDYRLLEANQRFLQFINCSIDQVKGKTPLDLGLANSDWLMLKEMLSTQNSIDNLELTTAWAGTEQDTVILSVRNLALAGEECYLVAATNITELKKTQEELRESEERYRSVFDHSLDGIILNEDASILSANPAACRILGRTEAELCALGWEGVVDLADPRLMAALKETRETFIFNSEITLVHKDGTKFPAEVKANYFDRHGQLLSSTILRDITERKNTEEAMRLSEEKFAKAFHQNQTMMAITKVKDGVYVDVNDRYATELGFKREELIGKSSLELGVWADLQDREIMLQQLAEYGSIRSEVKFRSKAGETGYVVANVSLLDIGGEPCLLSSDINITAQKKTEEELRTTKELFYKTFNANPLPMIITTKNGTHVEVNEAYSKRSGYTREEMIGLNVAATNIWVDLKALDKYGAEIEEKGLVENFETMVRNKSGGTSNVLLSGVTIVWNNEPCILTITNDITELRRYQQQIARLASLTWWEKWPPASGMKSAIP